MPVVPEQCRLWKAGDLTSDELNGAFEVVSEYVDESHLIRRLDRCAECGQLYFYEFYEEIDWVAGNDPQYRTYIPVKDAAEAARLSEMNRLELLSLTPRLNKDYPSDAKEPRIYWVRAATLH